MYESRKYRQEDIAEVLNIPLISVMKTTQMFGHHHTVRPLKIPIFFKDDFDYLEKYDF
jgi:hypothetical protein